MTLREAYTTLVKEVLLPFDKKPTIDSVSQALVVLADAIEELEARRGD